MIRQDHFQAILFLKRITATINAQVIVIVKPIVVHVNIVVGGWVVVRFVVTRLGD